MAEPTKRIYESTLGLPPLKMVLVHARNEAQNAAYRPELKLIQTEAPAEEPVDKEQAIRRLIEALEESD
jgi:hypothetical protein